MNDIQVMTRNLINAGAESVLSVVPFAFTTADHCYCWVAEVVYQGQLLRGKVTPEMPTEEIRQSFDRAVS